MRFIRPLNEWYGRCEKIWFVGYVARFGALIAELEIKQPDIPTNKQIRRMTVVRSKFIALFSLLIILAVASGCSEPLSKREQGGLIGGGVGAGAGAIIGSTVGHAAVGALIGGPVGLLAGALIGDQLMSQDHRQDEQQRQIDQNQEELQRLRRENERLRENQQEQY